MTIHERGKSAHTGSILFHNIRVRHVIKDKERIRKAVGKMIRREGARLSSLDIILCSDRHLLQLNLRHLRHNTYTDILTFDRSEKPGKIIEGDLYISIDRVRENAVKFKTGVSRELRLVVLHGVLHLLGYNDKTEKERKKMRDKEKNYLNLKIN